MHIWPQVLGISLNRGQFAAESCRISIGKWCFCSCNVGLMRRRRTVQLEASCQSNATLLEKCQMLFVSSTIMINHDTWFHAFGLPGQSLHLSECTVKSGMMKWTKVLMSFTENYIHILRTITSRSHNWDILVRIRLSLSISLSLYISLYLSISFYISWYISLYISLCISLYLSISLYISLYLSLYLSISLYISLYLSLHISL